MNRNFEPIIIETYAELCIKAFQQNAYEKMRCSAHNYPGSILRKESLQFLQAFVLYPKNSALDKTFFRIRSLVFFIWPQFPRFFRKKGRGRKSCFFPIGRNFGDRFLEADSKSSIFGLPIAKMF